MKKFEAFKLRLALLRVWFMKNLVVFFELLFFVGLILILTGQIDENTPVLGIIFGEMSVAIREALSQNSSTGEFWTDLASVVATILVSTGILSTNLKRIGIADIKSKNLKRALVQAGMYFNQDGKLVKRIEEASRIDLNGDRIIGDTGISVDDLPKEGFLPGIKRAGEELGTILTMKIETVDDAKAIEQKTELESTKEALKPVDAQIKVDAENLATNKIAEAIDTVVKEPGIVKKISSGVWRAAKTGASATGTFFVNIGKAIGNAVGGAAVFVWKKVSGIFKKKDKVAKQPKVKKEKVKASSKAVVAAAPAIQQKPIEQLTPEERRQLRLQKMKQEQQKNNRK